MINSLRSIPLTRRHPRSRTLSRYLDGDPELPNRHALEAHVRECARCQRLLASLIGTVGALRGLEQDTPSGLADSIIVALRAEGAPQIAIRRQSPDSADSPALTVIRGSARQALGNGPVNRQPVGVRAALRYCVQRAQLRLTLPIAVVAGVALSLINAGGMLFHGRIDLGMCAMCAADFLVPFLALNLALLMVLGVFHRRRT